MSIEKPFANNTLATFVYEPFSYTISNPGSYTLTTSNVTTGIPPGYIVNDGTEVIFSSSSNAMGVGTEIFTITAKDASGTTVAVSSNTVTVGAGRFLDLTGNSYFGSNFAFYKNEPITPLSFVAPFAIATPTAQPTLPPGLSYTSNASNTYSITGTPLVTVPQSNYLVIGNAVGSNLGKIVTSRFGLSVSNERILMNLEGSPIVGLMTVGTPIPQRTLTSAFPPYPYGGTLRYSWSGVPDGITVTDIGGVPQNSPFTPLDLSSTLVIQGAPTVAAANAYRNAGITSNVVTFSATRTNPLPQISNSLPITFGFGETVLFDSVTVPTLYSGVALDPSAISFRAETYFGSGAPITSMTAPSLPVGLSLNFVAGTGRGYLTGTPTTTSAASYTITATNSNVISRSLAVPISVVTDTMTFVSPTPNPVDASYNFVLSRPISAELSGYYTSNIQFRAVAASGNAVTFSTSSLTGTGLSLSNVNSNTVQLVGTPEAVTSFGTATLTATAAGTLATASTTFKFEILNDDISFSQPSVLQRSFIQNRSITPIQLSATTLSERPVISFSSSNLPSGLTITTTGLISGTPLTSSSGTFDVIASTGYMSDSNPYSYTLTPDSIILIERPSPSYALTMGGPIPAATVSGLSYSGGVVSNFVFTDVSTSTYGITIGNTTGVFGGTLTTSFPPDLLLPSNVTFSVRGAAGLLAASLPVELNTSNAPRYQWFALKGNHIVRTESNLNDWSSLMTTSMGPYYGTYPLTDYSIRPITVDTRGIVGVTNTNEIAHSADGTTFSIFEIPRTPWPFFDPSAPNVSNDTTLRMGPNVVARVSNSTTLYGAGYDWEFTQIGNFWKSTDDGVTWTGVFPLLATGLGGLTWLPNAASRGNVIAYKNGVLLIAGANVESSIIRSTDEGDTWAVAGASTGGWWPMALCTDADRWIFAGSSYYASTTPWSGAPGVRTLQYSDDQGATWSLVTSGDFDYLGDFVIYGNGIWIAAGRMGVGDTYAYPQFRTSTDGLTWTSFTINDVTIYPVPAIYVPENDDMRSTLVDSILYDGENYIILLRQVTNNGSDPLNNSYFPYAYTHAADGSDLSTGWIETSMATLTNIGDYATGPIRLKGRYPVSTSAPTPILSFPSQAGNGPTVTSPTNTSILLYQYAPMVPITFSATGTGTVYFFVQDAELPRGITFNSVTNTLSGTAMLIGNSSATIYVKDDNGVTLLTIQFRVIIPAIDRQQTSAGAWTSLIRQYTVVNAAQNSSNGKTLPATEPPLGEFMRPPPPDSVNVLPCPKC